jgi:hypothetical protein
VVGFCILIFAKGGENMYQVILYTAESNSLKTYRTVTFNTYLAASEFVDKFAALDLDEYENSEEFAETGEYPDFEMFYEIIAA